MAVKKCIYCEDEFNEEELSDDDVCPTCVKQVEAEDAHENKLLNQEIQEELEAFNREAGYE